MASSRRFFGYDPYDYYYTSPYDYAYPYYTHTRYPAAAPPAARRHASPRFFPAAADEEYLYGEPVETADVLRPSSRRSRARSVSVPVQFAGSEPEMETRTKGCEMRAPRSVPVAKIEREDAAMRVQAAARGFLARRMVQEVRAVEAEAEEAARKVEAEAEALRRDARGRIAIGEALMRLLLRLDAVHGAREYRRKVTKRVLALQDAVDALEHTPAPVEVADDATPAVHMEEAHDAQENMMTPSPAQEASQLHVDAVDMEEAHDAVENEAAPGSPRAAEDHGVEAEPKSEVKVAAPETGAEMEVDNAVEQVVGGEMQEPEEEAEGEWEMVTAESHTEVTAAVETAENSAAPEARGQEPAVQEEEKKVAVAEGVEMKKVMEMVAALCERSAEQCAVIGALAERVDALERAVRRVEESDRRRHRNKKLKKEGKANSKSIRSCFSD